MKNRINILLERLKNYEKKHPLKIVVWTAFLIFLLFGVVYLGSYFIQVSGLKATSYVHFSDRNFEREVKKILKTKNITYDDLKNISVLEIENNSEIESIEDLVYFENLTSLSIKNCNISDISIIEKLENLIYLDLSGNNISDLKPLSKCYTLEEVWLANNKITDISPLYSLNNIEVLMVQNNNISELESGIGEMERLYSICLDENRLISIDELANVKKLSHLYAASNKLFITPRLEGLENLIVLDLGNNAFQQLGYMGDLEQLQELSIDRNYLDDLEVLQSCPELIKLDLSYNQYTSLKEIDQCKNLQYLDIRGTHVEDVSLLEELEEFNTIYVDDNFDRTQLDFLINNFRNGDIKTKQYLLTKQYNL